MTTAETAEIVLDADALQDAAQATAKAAAKVGATMYRSPAASDVQEAILRARNVARAAFSLAIGVGLDGDSLEEMADAIVSARCASGYYGPGLETLAD